MSAWSPRKTCADDEGAAALDSNHGTSYGPTGGSADDGGAGAGAGADAGAGDAGSACESCTGSAYGGDETDDISDILGVGLGGLPTLSASGQLSVLSASAVEFTPGGQQQHQHQHQHQQQQDRADLLLPEHEHEGEGGQAAVYVGFDGEGEGEGEGDGVFYAEVQLEAEVLELMAESFSDCSLESLQVALAKSDWDLERASAAVLSTLETVCDPSLATKPCRHLLLGGECRRSDCTFSHDFAATTCRFWLQGGCANAAGGCHFLHDLEVPLPDDKPADPAEEVLACLAGGTVGGDSDAAALVYGDGGGSGGGGGGGGEPGLKTEEFPMLAPKKTSPEFSWGPPGGPAAAAAGAAAAAPAVSVSNVARQQDPQLEGSASDDKPPGRGREADEGHGGGQGENEDEGEDELLAAVVHVAAATRNGAGNNGRKGGRKGGRKTRFTAVNLQALLKPTGTTCTAPAPAPAGEPRKLSFPSASTPASSQPPRSWGTPASRQPASEGLAGEGGLLAPRPVENDLTFADVVGTSPPPPAARELRPGAARVAARSLQAGAPGVTAWRSSSSSSRHGNGTHGGSNTALGAASAGGSGGGGAWVSTGDAVREQYEQARMEAGELARSRNKLFTSATEAFRRGQGMVARDLARRGRELNLRMKEKHRQAASEIFRSRNPGDQVFERRTIDLHGLHVSEAVEVLDVEMEALTARGVSSVRVLTGTGHHSKGPTSKTRLIPAVEYFCQARGFPLAKIPDRTTGHVGAVDINFAGLLEHGMSSSQGGRGGYADDDHAEDGGGGAAAAYAYHGR